nr:pentapeptide repeat-containing protein [Streptomyces sp. 846.5]
MIALHELYRAAGKPPFRKVAETIKNNDSLSGTFSPDTVGKVLNGSVVPSWARLQALITYFHEHAVGSREDSLDKCLGRCHRIWLTASDEPNKSASFSTQASAESIHYAPRSVVDTESVLRDLESDNAGRQLRALYDIETIIWRSDYGQSGPLTPQLVADFLLRHSLPLERLDQMKNLTPLDQLNMAARILRRLPDTVRPGISLDGLRMPNLQLSGAVLRNVRLRNAHLYASSLNRADLTLSLMSGSDLTCVGMVQSLLGGADLSRSCLNDTTLTRAHLFHAKLQAAVIDRAKFMGAEIGSCSFDGSRGSHTDFSDATATRASFRNARLDYARFGGATLDHADFSNAHLRGAVFFGANLTHARFEGAKLDGCNFRWAILNNVEFTDEQRRQIYS